MHNVWLPSQSKLSYVNSECIVFVGSVESRRCSARGDIDPRGTG